MCVTGDVKDLCYDISALEGFCFKFVTNPKGLCAHASEKRTDGNILGCKSNNNATIFRGTIVEIMIVVLSHEHMLMIIVIRIIMQMRDQEFL